MENYTCKLCTVYILYYIIIGLIMTLKWPHGTNIELSEMPHGTNIELLEMRFP